MHFTADPDASGSAGAKAAKGEFAKAAKVNFPCVTLGSLRPCGKWGL